MLKCNKISANDDSKASRFKGRSNRSVCVSGFNGGGVSWWVPTGEVITDSPC